MLSYSNTGEYFKYDLYAINGYIYLTDTIWLAFSSSGDIWIRSAGDELS